MWRRKQTVSKTLALALCSMAWHVEPRRVYNKADNIPYGRCRRCGDLVSRNAYGEWVSFERYADVNWDEL